MKFAPTYLVNRLAARVLQVTLDRIHENVKNWNFTINVRNHWRYLV